jgi:hypothetical protein
MRKRLLYGSAIVLLVVSVLLVVWQGSFRIGFGPRDASQTFAFWAISSLIFILMVTLGFILFRTGLKLYIERQTNQEGSRLKSKLVWGALLLSFLPVLFLVLFSYQVLNRSLAAWFSSPAENQVQLFVKVGSLLQHEMQDEVDAQTALLAAQPRSGSCSPGLPALRLSWSASAASLDFARRPSCGPVRQNRPIPGARLSLPCTTAEPLLRKLRSAMVGA